jgi:ATP-dependent Clp protease ATP-binding subunit ClpB
VAERLAERGIVLVLTDAARGLVGDLGYDPVYGARPLKRVIQKQIVDRLALALLDGRLKEGERVAVDAVDGQLIFAGLPGQHTREPATARRS